MHASVVRTMKKRRSAVESAATDQTQTAECLMDSPEDSLVDFLYLSCLKARRAERRVRVALRRAALLDSQRLEVRAVRRLQSRPRPYHRQAQKVHQTVYRPLISPLKA